jgi:hypothetical protein
MIRRFLPRLCVPIVIAIAVAGCGDDDSNGGSSTPTGPGNTTSNPPPSGAALISGNWNGTSDFQQGGVRYISNVTMQVTQFDRRVEGNFTFTSPEYSGWGGTFTGQLTGTGSETQFAGTITLTMPTSTGTGTCIGQTVMSGRSSSTVMRWESPSMDLVPNGPTPGEGCRGRVLTLVWIFGR